MRAIHTAFQSQKIRFGLVGLVNTIIDFFLLNILVIFIGWPLIASNIISTAVAVVVSFFLNKNKVFRSDQGSKRQALLFLLVTLAGLWIVQTFVIAGLYQLLGGLPDELRLNVAKLAGIVSSMTWNYIWYSRFIFTRR